MSNDEVKTTSRSKGTKDAGKDRKQAGQGGLTAEAPNGTISYCKIYPGVGIARVGNSPDQYFVGPESPGYFEIPDGGYKDPEGRIKRQAARYRVYAYDENDNVVCELTSSNANITWTVHLANKKADWYEFRGSYRAPTDEQPDRRYITDTEPRNIQMPGNPGDDSRKALVIDAGAHSISGSNQQSAVLEGTFGPLPLIVPPMPKPVVYQPNVPGQVPCGFYATMDNSAHTAAVTCPDTGSQPESQPIAPNTPYSPQVTVPLGELRTDDQGRLMVLGGFGKSASVWNTPVGKYPDWMPSYNANGTQFWYANNDFWYDDISDGPVTAQVTFEGRDITVKGNSWVIVAPPKFAPAHINLTSLYDVAKEVWQLKNNVKQAARPSFTRDIYPIFERLTNLQWVTKLAYEHHGAGILGQGPGETGGDFVEDQGWFQYIKDNSETARPYREFIFTKLRNPNLAITDPKAMEQANYTFMPQIFGDNGQPPPYNPTAWQSLLVSQYETLSQWAKGNFDADWVSPSNGASNPQAANGAKPLAKLPPSEQPAALDQAALEPCVGGPFYPGIEITYIATFFDTWSDAFRINQRRKGADGIEVGVYEAGDLSKHMALPWQADFFECNLNWWPAQRPDDVVPEAEYNEVLATYNPSQTGQVPLSQALGDREMWARGLPPPQDDSSYPDGDNQMVKVWHEMGFVVPVTAPNGELVYIEKERDPYAVLTIRDKFYILMNIDSYPDFLPRARKIVNEYLAQAWESGQFQDPTLNFFEYAPESFNGRLMEIYDEMVAGNVSDTVYEEDIGDFKEDPTGQTPQSTREQAIYRILQMAPFNQLDGAWLRGATQPGPIDDVHSMIFSIYMDEMGDGNVSQQHCNVYTDLLRSVQIYLPEIHTREYADNPALLDTSFENPVFLLAISQLSEEFFPEILGMTLELEWGSAALWTAIDQLNAFGIDPLYYVLHLGIDNAASGHGAIAKQAVETYLDMVRANEGDKAMREAWKRIWTGYVAFATIGDVGNQTLSAPTLYDQMVNMIIRKQPFGSLNHRDQMLGPNSINEWFSDPAGFLAELVKAGIVVPGQPNISPMMQLMSFNGPMYHVFTQDEQSLWINWIEAGCPLDDSGVQPPDFNVVKAMHVVIDFLRERQQGNIGHNVQLTGPNPFFPAEPEHFVTQSIHWWFDLKYDSRVADPNGALMSALSFEKNGWVFKGDSARSPIVRSMLSGNGSMAQDFRSILPGTAGIVPGSPGLTYAEVLIMWIDEGCETDAGRAPTKLRFPRTVSAMSGAAPTMAKAAPTMAKSGMPKKKRQRKMFGNGLVH
jgi:L-Lysine epsilon oxidase N-terminal/L-lysine epsilon oxidase C-terminal domain/Iron-containing redox enzyme